MITYKENTKEQTAKIYLDGRTVGKVKHLDDGWAYFPKHASNSVSHGDVFKTMAACIRSLVGTTEKENTEPKMKQLTIEDAASSLLAELEEVLEWALVEKAPLRKQEINSIKKTIKKAKKAGVK